MNKMKFTYILFCFCTGLNCVFAQESSNIKFGKISLADFQITTQKYDTGTNAIIISDIGKTSFTGNGHGFFSIVFTRFMRVKILNKNGFHEADNRIYLYNDRKGTNEKVFEIKGSTFNMENGVIQETKLDSKSLFQEKYNPYIDLMKFTMPALKEGSVFDISYTVKSNYFAKLPTWTFQHGIPCLWSEYEVTIPSMFHYLIKKNGDAHFEIETTKPVMENFAIQRNAGTELTDEFTGVTCTSYRNRWVKKNVPVLKSQPYISTIDNYLSSISFEENYYQQDLDHDKSNHIFTWDTLSHKLLTGQDFGFELNQDNRWMDEELKGVVMGSLNPDEETRRIYQYVREHFHCTDYNYFYIETSLKDVFKKRTGNVGELNLLLVAMLRHQNIKADPAILSTRDNGVTTPEIALLHEYNYLICIANPTGNMITLDASRPFNPFGKLPHYCNNWNARVISEKNPLLIKLIPDSVTERGVDNLMFVNDENGNFSGTVKTVFGDYASNEIREKIKTSSEKEYFKNFRTEFTEFEVSNEKFDSLYRPEHPLTLNYQIDLKNIKGADIIYFNPVVNIHFSSNPFVADERLFPVEMDYKMDYSYFLTMEIPKGFQVDEIPKSARVNYGDKQGMFEYLIQQNPDNVQMRLHLKFNKATFSAEEYPGLRDFFAYVVKKESEQIVFKKIH
jgi:hypothetical protein